MSRQSAMNYIKLAVAALERPDPLTPGSSDYVESLKTARDALLKAIHELDPSADLGRAHGVAFDGENVVGDL